MLAVLFNADELSALGALFTGFASLLAAVLSIRWTKRKARDECVDRIRELRKTFDRGVEIGTRLGRPS